MSDAFLLFAPFPPFTGRTHLIRPADRHRTVCGRATRECRPLWTMFGTGLKFGWSISDYHNLDQVRGKLCRSCQAH